ncbi:hypothetical protein DFA_05385 [Cavenderia fasciculata]|uniref:Amino acid transporter transmembrane domain-containing protein n=1 Tax=Cavenderia fasciculata TaxID=261658 RepID=F4PL31_CACFS|nr:uncharacterized protein DFA_05385 [Cavenderia fasciculata]EGG23253.1 hypothetical protein DFA_05385 [Cavenderia fasciculata]|eukprot:XP_004361104.1 hypothetical protein DFA_05385 [Cavenderia fasciculata]
MIHSTMFEENERTPLMNKVEASAAAAASTIDGSTTEKQTLDESSNKSERNFTPVQALGNTIKAFGGAGAFALPWAMSQAGIFIGSIGLVLIALLANYTMTILLKFTMSICIAYLILIGSNFEMLTSKALSSSTCIWILFPIVLLLTFLTDMKYLGFTSIFGAGALILAMITVISYGIKDYSIEPLSEYKVDYANIPLWFGVAAFFFCNHIVVIPISHASGDCRRYPRVLDASMLFITIFNVLFAILGYLYFNFANINGVVGVPANIVEALPDGIFANIVRACVIAELVCSFPILAGAGLNVVESSSTFFHRHFSAFPENANNNKITETNSKETNSKETFIAVGQPQSKTKFLSRNWKFYVIRVVIVGILAAIGTTIKTFGSYTSLIGSLMLAVAGFVVPPLLYIRFFPDQTKLSKIIHIAITVFGVAATILGTYQSIDALVKGDQSGAH